MSNNNETSLIMVHKCIIETKQWFGRSGTPWCLPGRSNYPVSAKNCKLMLFIRIFAFHWNILNLVQIVISWQSESLFPFFFFFFFQYFCSVRVTFYSLISRVFVSIFSVWRGWFWTKSHSNVMVWKLFCSFPLFQFLSSSQKCHRI